MYLALWRYPQTGLEFRNHARQTLWHREVMALRETSLRSIIDSSITRDPLEDSQPNKHRSMQYRWWNFYCQGEIQSSRRFLQKKWILLFLQPFFGDNSKSRSLFRKTRGCCESRGCSGPTYSVLMSFRRDRYFYVWALRKSVYRFVSGHLPVIFITTDCLLKEFVRFFVIFVTSTLATITRQDRHSLPAILLTHLA